ncbi:MAG: undecaprenyl diphosphate synthase family protein, partial [Phycisphaerales bacterium]
MPEAADERGTGDRVPRHVAIIMDGNGRWANARGLPRIAGHREGARRGRAVVEACARAGVEALTLYTFTSENRKRPDEEVAPRMELA